jgi:ABC-type transporter Mla subunit MlaD
MAEELIYKVGVEGTNELDKLETSVEKAGESTNKTRLYMSELSNELKKARGDMLKYAKGTEEYNKALEKSSRITSQINDTSAKMNTSVKDLGITTQKVSGALAGFAGGFQVVQATMSLFGVENEETIKTVLRLQQTMSIVQGLTAFAQGINEAKDMLAAFRASNHQLNEDLKNTGDGMEGVSKSSDNMGDSFKTSGKEAAVLGSNLAGNTKLADDLSKGLEKIGGDAHIANVQRLSNLTEIYEQQLESANQHLNSFTRGTDEYNGVLDMVNRTERNLIETQAELTAALKSGQKATEDGIKFTKDGIEVVKDSSESQKDLSKNLKKSGNAFASFAKTIGKSLLTMSAFLAVIALVTWGISELIK